MRFTHARPAVVTLMTGGALLTAVSGISLAAVAGSSASSGHLSGYAISAAADGSASAASDTSCEPLKLRTAKPSPSPTPKPTPSPTPTPTKKPKPSPSPTPTKASPSPSPSPSASVKTSITSGSTFSRGGHGGIREQSARLPGFALPTPTVTPTPTPTVKPTPTATATVTPAPAPTATPKASATLSKSGQAQPTASGTPKPKVSGSPTPSPTRPAQPEATAQGTPTATARPPAKTPKPAAKIQLCVAVTRSQASSRRGAAAQWTISAWTTGGDVPDSTLRLTATPAGQAPQFSFGCGSYDGTASCDLGAMDAKSAKRQLQARVTVPADASTVSSVVLTATGSAAHLPRDPVAAATVAITAAAVTVTPPVPSTAPLAVGSLPDIPTPSPTLSPGGNAAGLFPTLQPSAVPSPTITPARKASTRPVANTSALPEGSSAVGAQLAGLGALALAFVLAVTRLTIRRRPVPVPVPAPPTSPESPAAGPVPAAETEPAAGPGAAETEPAPEPADAPRENDGAANDTPGES